MGLLGKYIRWLHTQWPAGKIEKLPHVAENGTTNVPGLYIVGDLTGIPLLKLSADSGARAVQSIVNDDAFRNAKDDGAKDVKDLVIIGGGVSGMSAAMEAKKHNLDFEVLEASEPFSTIINFPKAKPIYTYPTEMTPAGQMRFTAKVKEPLVRELRAQTLENGITPVNARAESVIRQGKRLEITLAGGKQLRARRVIVAIGRSGNFRKLGVHGETLDKVYNRLHDPADFCGKNVLVVGGGDSALETAIALTQCGCNVTVSYRKNEFSRPKPDNVERIDALLKNTGADVSVEEPSSERITTSAGGFLGDRRKAGTLRLALATEVKRIDAASVTLVNEDNKEEILNNDVVFAMIGREAPLDFFRRSGVRIRGEWKASTWAGFTGFLLFCMFLYHWKKDIGIPINSWFLSQGWFPYNVAGVFENWFSEAANRRTHLLYTLKKSMSEPSFYYTLAYCACVVVFGVGRMRRRKTPYVKVQTLVLMAIQCFPLFILPEIVLPWAGRNGAFSGDSALTGVADQFFERTDNDKTGEERAYWRAYGFILAWPLFIYNIFTDSPMWGWLIVGFLQTCVVIPLLIYRFGKGSYCGWICSCGALAETLGDAHRHKMPHGSFWNRMNLIGQGILAIALLMLCLRILGWMWPGSAFDRLFALMLGGIPFLNYKWFVDLLLAGIIGLGCYFWLSGRVWCRFACPLAALMHIYARFSRFRILADKKKCISCNVCTSVCHQGIDIMNFANKGLPMEDPQCVRCSACVQMCPTGVLEFGQINRETGQVISRDTLVASLIRDREK